MILAAVSASSTAGRERAANLLSISWRIVLPLTMWIKFTTLDCWRCRGASAQTHRTPPTGNFPLEIVAASLAFWRLARQSLYSRRLTPLGRAFDGPSSSAEMLLRWSELGKLFWAGVSYASNPRSLSAVLSFTEGLGFFGPRHRWVALFSLRCIRSKMLSWRSMIQSTSGWE